MSGLHHDMNAQEVIALLDLEPHPEGGYFCETFRDEASVDGRAHSTAIYFLLPAGEVSRWHRVDAVESWHHYAGAPLALRISEDGVMEREIILGNDLVTGQRPQAIVPKESWQSAESLGSWTLVGCVVAPAFQFEGFELAPENWEPGKVT